MVRYRRYRAFLVFAVIAIFALYEFSGFSNVASAIGAGSLKQVGINQEHKPHDPVSYTDSNAGKAQAGPELVQPETPEIDAKVDVLPPSPTKQNVPVATQATANSQEQVTQEGRIASPVTAAANKPTFEVVKPQDTPIGEELHELDELAEVGEGRKEVTAPPAVSSVRPIHWSKQPEHFPVETTIQLPTASPVSIPRIQYNFGKESSSEKEAREEKLKIISDALAHAWSGYREKAWMRDEVLPVTGGARDPFCGWAATLVDALDTLWIAGMKSEFEAAVEAVGNIDFTTSQRKDIPLFETTIRYLGGMLSAYDLSGGKYRILLDKAVELADILMGAFDTPNRMPVTYYRWMPAFASQPHRAGTHVVLAELGSLSMEFTRLAQLTKEPRYYDAIDRITDAFLDWQNASGSNATLVPGLFPTYVDASGCEKPMQIKTHHSPNYAAKGGSVVVGDGAGVKAEKPVAKEQSSLGKPKSEDDASRLSSEGKGYDPGSRESQESGFNPNKGKITGWGAPLREGDLDNLRPSEKLDPSGSSAQADADTAANRGSSQGSTANKGKIIGWDDPVREGDLDSPEAKAAILSGATSDNLSKRQLGDIGDEVNRKDTRVLTDVSGNDDRDARILADTVAQKETETKKTLDKPVCIPRGLASGNTAGTDGFTIGGMADSLYEYFPKQYLLLGGVEDKYRVLYERSMDAVIDKLLFRPMTPNDSDILFSGEYSAYREPDIFGKYGKLKPEGAHLTCFAGGMFAMGAKIFGRKEDLELGAKLTEGCVWAYNVTNSGIMPEHFLLSECDSTRECAWNETKYFEDLDPYKHTRTVESDSKPDDSKYQPEEDTKVVVPKKHKRQPEEATPNLESSPTSQETVPEPAPRVAPARRPYTPPTQPTHSEFVLARIQDERLPLGMTRVTGRNYILRPEAIESVFYMYRITGDSHWREVGWQMWEAIHKHTYAPYGASALHDVTKAVPELKDQEESFWIAETLKYFFLLFSEEDVLSLDEWVLNTEAHPFKRPLP